MRIPRARRARTIDRAAGARLTALLVPNEERKNERRKRQRWTVDAHQQPVEIKQRVFDLRLWLLGGGGGVGHGFAECTRSVDGIVFLRDVRCVCGYQGASVADKRT